MWRNVEQLVSDLQLEVDPADREAIVTLLRQRLKSLHPDSYGKGRFQSDADRAEFENILAALRFVEGSVNTAALVPIDVVGDIVARAVTSALSQTPTLSQELARDTERDVSRVVHARRREIGSHWLFPKVSFTGLAALLVFLLALPEQASKNVFLRGFSESSSAHIYWIVTLVVTSVLAVRAWWVEGIDKARVAYMHRFDTQRDVLAYLMNSTEGPISRSAFRAVLRRRVYGYREESSAYDYAEMPGVYGYAEAPDFYRYRTLFFRLIGVYGRIFRRLLLLRSNRGASEDALDEATDLALQRFAERGWIRRVPGTGLEDWYEGNAL